MNELLRMAIELRKLWVSHLGPILILGQSKLMWDRSETNQVNVR